MNLHTLRRRMPVLILALLTLSVLLPAVSTGAMSSTSRPPDFAAIDDYIAAEMQAQRIPGLALGIVQGDQIVHLKGFGVANTSGGVVTPQTPFPIGKVSKAFTALAVMQLVEAGKLNLDTPVQRYLPWFRVADEAASVQITVRHLLTQTSGLSHGAGL